MKFRYLLFAAGLLLAAFAHAQPAINVPSADGSLTHVAWKPAGKIERWIVSLHGTGGSAKKDVEIWQRSLGGRQEGPHSRGVAALALPGAAGKEILACRFTVLQ